MPRVWNKRDKNVPADAVYIGRPTKWGNPFTHLKGPTRADFFVESREDAVRVFSHWIQHGGGKHLLKDLHELKGKDLVCWCAPQSCHGDILLQLANKR